MRRARNTSYDVLRAISPNGKVPRPRRTYTGRTGPGWRWRYGMTQEQRISRRTAVHVAGAALVASAALGAELAPRSAQAGAGSKSPVGVWVVTSTRAGQIPNGVLLTIHLDGTLLRIGTNHPAEAPGVGVWQQV